MHFDQPLVKLPIRFCAETLAAEVRALPKEAWTPHPQRFAGNEYVPLITPGGRITNDFVGPMGPTDFLLRSPYMMEAMAELGATCGRSRLMGLGPGGEVPIHVDTNYYWRTHIRVHIPVSTNSQVDFTCGDQTVHMAAGECWIFDTFRKHRVENRGQEQRVHLVLDTVGGERLWDLIDAARRDGAAAEQVLIEPGKGSGAPMAFEQHNFPKLMSPWELRTHFDELLDRAGEDPRLDAVRRRLDRLAAGWAGAWARFEAADEGLPAYRQLMASCRMDLERIGGHGIQLRNGRPLYDVLAVFVFDNAIGADRVRRRKTAIIPPAQRLAS